MMTSDLLSIGLSKNEADVYIACLELGATTAPEIAAKAELNRTTCYGYIRGLIERGLLSMFEKNGKQFYIAEKPEKLKFFCEQQEKELQRRKKAIESILPELESIYKMRENNPRVKQFKDSELQEMRESIYQLRANEILNIFNYQEFFTYSSKQHIQRLLETSQTFNVLYISENKILDKTFHFMLKNPAVKFKYLPVQKFNILTEMTVFDNDVYFSTREKTIAVHDKLLAQTIIILFNVLWELAEDFDYK